MRNTNFLLLLLVPVLLSCNRQPNPELLAALPGEWYFQGKPSAGYSFSADGSFSFWDEEVIDAGSWTLRGKEIECLGGDGAWSARIDVEGDSLFWGRSVFVKAKATGDLRERLLGAWTRKTSTVDETYEFFPDGQLLYTLNEENYTRIGKWQLTGNELELDLPGRGPEPIRIYGNTLIWGLQRFSFENTPPANLSDQLVGRWYTDQLGQGVSFTFLPDGTFQSYDGRYEAGGSWKLSGRQLILDDYEASATPIGIQNDMLKWGEALYTRQEVEGDERWWVKAVDGSILSADLQTGKNFILADDEREEAYYQIYRLLARVGPYVCIGVETKGGTDPDTRYMRVMHAGKGDEVKLTDLFPASEVFAALMKVRRIQKAIPEGETPANLEELIELADGGCAMHMGDNLVRSFAFYDLQDGKASIRLGLPAGCPQENGRFTVLGIYLKIPDDLKAPLNAAHKNKSLMSDWAADFK